MCPPNRNYSPGDEGSTSRHAHRRRRQALRLRFSRRGRDCQEPDDTDQSYEALSQCLAGERLDLPLWLRLLPPALVMLSTAHPAVVLSSCSSVCSSSLSWSRLHLSPWSYFRSASGWSTAHKSVRAYDEFQAYLSGMKERTPIFRSPPTRHRPRSAQPNRGVRSAPYLAPVVATGPQPRRRRTRSGLGVMSW
jgi:hypothetical protein